MAEILREADQIVGQKPLRRFRVSSKSLVISSVVAAALGALACRGEVNHEEKNATFANPDAVASEPVPTPTITSNSGGEEVSNFAATATVEIQSEIAPRIKPPLEYPIIDMTGNALHKVPEDVTITDFMLLFGLFAENPPFAQALAYLRQAASLEYNEAQNIDLILQNSQDAAYELSSGYCRMAASGDVARQRALSRLQVIATITYHEVQRNIKLGYLRPDAWNDIGSSFNLPCKILDGDKTVLR